VRLPAGTRDWLPPELRRKRAVENALRGVFERWAYAEAQTPSFERFDVLENGLGDTLAQATYLFGDRNGTQLALRPEMTTPIARLVSSRMREASLPIRLSYVQPVYRYAEPQEGRMREFTQAGLELIGAESADADAECLFTAIEALDALGLDDALFDINHAAVVDAVLVSLGLSAAQASAAKSLIARRDLVALREYVASLGHAGQSDTIVRLVMTRGRDEVLDAVRPFCSGSAGLAGLERLERLLARASDLGYADRIHVDLALLRDFGYYTGFIFEGFVGEVGFSLCGGGRYDDLLPRFGFEAGAVGWSAGIERLLLALERRHSAHFGAAPAIDVLVSGSDVIAARERAAGKIVRIDFDRRSEAELLEEARRQRIPRLVIVREGTTRELEVRW
jgi:ATP phosphoribosyltransferase regulatory subunit